MVSVGVDEVGRGCWAGPLVAGAVILNKPISGLKDSKKLTKKQREILSRDIKAKAVSVSLGWVMPTEIDDLGLTAAVRLAMQRALSHITTIYDEIIIDGNFNFLADDVKAKTVIKADDSVPSVSAASIIAKVSRDHWMAEAAQTFPSYHFDKHVGYGTKLHLDMLRRHGVCALHRLSFKPVQRIVADGL